MARKWIKPPRTHMDPTIAVIYNVCKLQSNTNLQNTFKFITITD